jgi:hypothetical protein
MDARSVAAAGFAVLQMAIAQLTKKPRPHDTAGVFDSGNARHQ